MPVGRSQHRRHQLLTRQFSGPAVRAPSASAGLKYLSKILRYAEPLQKRGRLTNDIVVAYAAAWSFKSNCGQHKAVAAFAKQSLDTNAFPSKKEFLKESIGAPKHAGHYR